MSNDKPATGKTYKGQSNYPVKTEADVAAEAAAQAPYNKEGAVSFKTYCAMKGIADPVMQAGMRAYTLVQRATVQDWDAIFKTY